MQTNHFVKKWQKNNIRSVYPEHNKWLKVTIKQSHKQFAYMNLKKTAQLKTVFSLQYVFASISDRQKAV
jgi:hypothetical protein